MKLFNENPSQGLIFIYRICCPLVSVLWTADITLSLSQPLQRKCRGRFGEKCLYGNNLAYYQCGYCFEALSRFYIGFYSSTQSLPRKNIVMVIIQKKITKIKRENKKHCEKLRQIMRNIFSIMFYGKVNTKNTKHRENWTNYEKYFRKEKQKFLVWLYWNGCEPPITH